MRVIPSLSLFTILVSVCASSQTSVILEAVSTVQFVVTDPSNRKMGMDPRYSKPPELWTRFEQIANATYGSDNSNEGGPSVVVFETRVQSPQCDGAYAIEMIGDTTQVTFLTVYVMPWAKSTQVQEAYFHVDKIPIERDSTIKYIFTYHGALGADVSLVKVVSTRSLTQDVAAMFRLGWISGQQTAEKYFGFIATCSAQILQNNTSGARATLENILQNVASDSAGTLTADACKSLRPDVEYLLRQLPAPSPGLVVKLINSIGANLTSGSLQYYDGTWKDATNNNDGTFNITTSLKTLSLRMTYEGGSQTKSNVVVGTDIVVFQTVNAQVKLQNSQGALIDTGTVQYYAGAWRSFGATTSGTATKELLPGSYSIRMTYVGGSNDKQQDIGSNPVVVFQTVNASVQLKNSQGVLMDQGTVQYYAGAWRSFGATVNGVVSKELLPNSYSFRMTYAFGSKDQQQNIGTNPTVVFQTVNATVQLKNSQGTLIDQGTVQYYSGAWRSFGTTSGGSVSKELLPINYSFRMTNEGVSNDKAQDISSNSIVSFSTVLCTVSVKNSQSQPVNNAQISYYSGAWRQIGPTVNGQVTKELLPANLTFRMTLGTTSQDKVQNIATNALVEFVVQ